MANYLLCSRMAKGELKSSLASLLRRTLIILLSVPPLRHNYLLKVHLLILLHLVGRGFKICIWVGHKDSIHTFMSSADIWVRELRQMEFCFYFHAMVNTLSYAILKQTTKTKTGYILYEKNVGTKRNYIILTSIHQMSNPCTTLRSKLPERTLGL